MIVSLTWTNVSMKWPGVGIFFQTFLVAFQQIMHPYGDKKTTVQSHAVYNKLRLVAAAAAASGLDQTKPWPSIALRSFC